MNNPERREVTLGRLEEIVTEVERLASGPVVTTGKHSFPSIVRHLALANQMSTGMKIPPSPPLLMRLLMPLIRLSVFNGPIKPGINLPANAEAVFWPSEEISIEDALKMLKDSVAYWRQHGPVAKHPIFGKASPEQMERLCCNHAAMHLSFVHPK